MSSRLNKKLLLNPCLLGCLHMAVTPRQFFQSQNIWKVRNYLYKSAFPLTGQKRFPKSNLYMSHELRFYGFRFYL